MYIYIYIWKTGEIKLRISQLVHRYYCMSCICVYTYIYIYIHIYIYIVWYHDVSLCVIMCHCYHIGWETMTISVRNICLIKLCHISPGANGDVFSWWPPLEPHRHRLCCLKHLRLCDLLLVNWRSFQQLSSELWEKIMEPAASRVRENSGVLLSLACPRLEDSPKVQWFKDQHLIIMV